MAERGRATAARLFFGCTLFVMVCCVSVGYSEELHYTGQKGQVAILSISPSKAEPGMDVLLYGSGFSATTRAFVGSKEAHTVINSPRDLRLTIPDHSPGLYALYLQRGDGAQSKVYSFTVLPRTPLVDLVSPDSIHACSSGTDRQVRLIGNNFQKGSQVLFDGTVIRSTHESAKTIIVSIPQVAAGLHTLQVMNPGGTLSSAMALFIDSKPKISSVSIGEQFVNYYNLLVEGQNFRSNLTFVVNGKSMNAASVNQFDREKIRYIDCSKIIYERHPYDSEVKAFSVQIINPDGEESARHEVSAP